MGCFGSKKMKNKDKKRSTPVSSIDHDDDLQSFLANNSINCQNLPAKQTSRSTGLKLRGWPTIQQKWLKKKSSPTTISQNSSIQTCNTVKKGTDMQEDDSSIDRFFISQGLEWPWTPHMTPEDFENVRKVWYIVGRKHLAIPMMQHMFKQVFNIHADARFLTKSNYQLVVYAPKKESVSNSFFNMFTNKINGGNPSTVNIDSIDSFVTSHTIYFWRTLNSIISHRKDSSWGVERLTELYNFHRNIYQKTGVPTKRHYQTFLEAMNDFLHKNLRHHCEQEQRESFHKFVNVIYYFMNYCEPDMKPWCEIYA